jgi:hypothetical protein
MALSVYDAPRERAVTNKTFPVICTLLCLLLAPLAEANSRKTDIVTLYNGDRITGEIVSLYAGILEYKTDAMGTLKIEWKEIARIQSNYNYEIRLSDGKRLYGSMPASSIPGQMQVIDLYGEQELESLAVVELRPIEKNWYERIDVYLSAGYSYTKASSVAQTTFNTEVSYEDEKTRNALTSRLTNTVTDNGDSNSSKLDLSRRIWTDRAELFRLFYGNHERNDELGLDSRVALGLGWGRYWIDTNRMRFAGTMGIQGVTEQRVGSSSRSESLELFISTDFASWQFDSPEMDISLTGNLYPSLTEGGRVRADTDLRIRWELVSDLFWDVTAFGTYDNESAQGGEFDYGITTGLGWKY